MAFYVYILECADGSFYTGHTDNLEKRYHEHLSGVVDSYTATRRPITLVYSKEFESRVEALTVERQIKGWSRAKKKAMIAGDWGEVSRLAQSRSKRPSRELAPSRSCFDKLSTNGLKDSARNGVKQGPDGEDI